MRSNEIAIDCHLRREGDCGCRFGTGFWRRPGGYPGGWGASSNFKGSDLLHLWTSAAAPFEPDHSYSKFAAYTLLTREGDFKATAVALAEQGYGERVPDQADATRSSAALLAAASELIAVPPFPVDAFPPVMRAFVVDGSKALGCPPEFVAMPLFVLIGAVAGNSRKLQIKPDWEVLPVIWVGVIGRPGSIKPPALDLSRKLVDGLQKDAWNLYQELLNAWSELPANERGPKPYPETYFVTDTTTQAVGFALMRSRGLTVVHDELAGWVKSFDAYSAAGDRQFWLSSGSAQPLKPNRKTGEPIFVPEPVIGVTGGIQPEVLIDLAGDAQRNDCFMPRYWLVWPDAPIALWTDAVMPAKSKANLLDVARQLRLTDDSVVVTRMSAPARAAWIAWFDENQRSIPHLDGIAAGWAAKAATHLARIVLVLHMVANPSTYDATVDLQTLQNGIAILEYLCAHLRRVLPMFGAMTPTYPVGLGPRIERILRTAWPDWVTRTELNDRLGEHEESQVIGSALLTLKTADVVIDQVVPTGGRSREEWRWVPEAERKIPGGKTEIRKKGSDDDLLPSSSVFPHDPVSSDAPAADLSPSSSVFPPPTLLPENEAIERDDDGWEHWEAPE